jgi:prepilin-type N-terminal cleavage/methylation domain-containing protein
MDQQSTLMKPSSAGAARRSSAGFTLVELLIVVVVLGILGSVVVFAVRGITGRGQQSACSADAATLTVAEEAAQANGSGYLPVAGLQSAGWLRTAPHHHDVQLSAGSYTIVADVACGGSATAGGAGTTTTTAAAATTTTTAAATTTTTTAAAATAQGSNGVSVQPSVAGTTTAWYGEDDLALTNSSAITALTVTIVVAKTPGVSYNAQWNNLWQGSVTPSTTTDATSVRYSWTSTNSALVPGSWNLAAAFDGTGTARVTTGDTWTVVATSRGSTVTLTGTF